MLHLLKCNWKFINYVRFDQSEGCIQHLARKYFFLMAIAWILASYGCSSYMLAHASSLDHHPVFCTGNESSLGCRPNCLLLRFEQLNDEKRARIADLNRKIAEEEEKKQKQLYVEQSHSQTTDSPQWSGNETIECIFRQ